LSDLSSVQLLDNIRIVMVGTTHAGNIGSAARAMKTMGMSDMRLVNPCKFSAREGDAYALASGAGDVLEQAQRVEDLNSAIADCSLVIGASARVRSLHWPILSPEVAAQKLVEVATKQPVALVLGRERTGLTNAEMDHCQFLVHIDANPEYSSLNLAMAVQVFAYEIRRTLMQNDVRVDMHSDDRLATAGELNFLFERLESTLAKADFLFQQDPQYMLRKIKRMVYRAELEHKEINIVQGIFTSVENKIKQLENQITDVVIKDS